MPVYDCGDPECGECQRAFGQDRLVAIAAYNQREKAYAPRTKWPWGEPWNLGRQHAMCGMPRLNPDFFRDGNDRANYVKGYDNSPRESY